MEDTLNTPLEVTYTPEDMVEHIISPETAPDLSKEAMPEFASNYLPLKDFYGIKDMDQETQGKLQDIWDYFKKDAKTPSTVLNKLKLEQSTMMQPNIGDTQLDMMYRYVRLLQDIDEAKDLKKAYKNDSKG